MELFTMIRQKGKNAKGFTLIELLLYMGILTILLGVLCSLFGTIVSVQLESTATSNVDQDGRYVLAKLSHDFHSANKITDTIVSPSIGQIGQIKTTLQMTVNSVNYTYSLDGNGNLQLVNDTGTNVLNSNETRITGLTFQRLGSGDTNDTVKISFTITSKTKQTTGFENKSFTTTIGFQ
jgi:type II secretory pathway pseudopilin PulG